MSSVKESVWDYPRPPRLEASGEHIKVIFADRVIADSVNSYRVLETSHPPTYYIPPEDVVTELLVANRQRSTTLCEFKGQARYFDIVDQESGQRAVAAVWHYADPSSAFASIRNYYAFYPSRVDACYVDDERVQAQEGDFYGGWITNRIQGPFKGGPGTWGW